MRKEILGALSTALFSLFLLFAVVVSGRRAGAPNADGPVPRGGTSQVVIGLGPADIGGVVTSSNGPEAGVWVIAETSELPTKLRKIVVTDDRGRYLIPDLPRAHYKVWVRGYGLIDSNRVDAELGKLVALKAVVAPDAQAAAQYYPASYWYSLMQVPPRSTFPIKTDGALHTNQGVAAAKEGVAKTQADWIEGLHSGCEMCHQMGDKATRELSPNLAARGESNLEKCGFCNVK